MWLTNWLLSALVDDSRVSLVECIHVLVESLSISSSSSSCVACTTQTQTSVSRVDDSEPQLSPHRVINIHEEKHYSTIPPVHCQPLTTLLQTHRTATQLLQHTNTAHSALHHNQPRQKPVYSTWFYQPGQIQSVSCTKTGACRRPFSQHGL